MKKIIPLLSMLFFSVYAFAQEAKPVDGTKTATFKHELGLNLFSITNVGVPKENLSNVATNNVYEVMTYNLPSGVYYKLHSGKNALRLSYDYLQRSYTENEYVDMKHVVNIAPLWEAYTYTYKGIKKEHEFKIGYQRSIGKKRFTGFFSTDLLLNYNKFTGSHIINWHPMETYSTVPFYNEQYKAGVALGGGLKYRITERISLTYEFSFTGVVSRTRDLAYRNSSFVTDLSLKLNPVRMIGIGYSF